MDLGFTWDPDKDAANIRKHGVSFAEAMTTFADLLSVTIPDPDHSVGEERFVTFGVSTNGRLLVVGHIEHGDIIRIITARPAIPGERKLYEEG